MEVLFYGLILFVFVKVCQWRNSQPSDVPVEDDMDFSRVVEETEKIETCNRQLQTLENLLTDITICNSEQHHKVFVLSWVNEATGENMSFDFWVNDSESDTAKSLLQLANTERSRLRSELQEVIDCLPENSRHTPPNPTEKILSDVVKKHKITE
ncbi:MAG: hypothetical protein NC177_07710 [Ruminococcus flavefaciens]|nr:hypothetical protein [Ruminococcus flavefaciens]